MLLKVLSGRGRDLGDVTTMLGLATEEQLSAVRAAFARWEAEISDDLESLIAMGKLEQQQSQA